MARYFFHIHDGETALDVEGIELSGLDEARREAVRFSGALLADHADQFWRTAEWTLRVTDADNLTLFQLVFIATESPAVLSP